MTIGVGVEADRAGGAEGARVRARPALRALFGQAIRFGMVTGMSVLVTVGVPVVLREVFGVAPQYGAAIAFACAFVLNFISMRRLVFRSSAGAGRDLVVFTISSLVFRLIEYGAFLAVLSIPGIHYVVGLVGVLGASTIAKFFWYRGVMR